MNNQRTTTKGFFSNNKQNEKKTGALSIVGSLIIVLVVVAVGGFGLYNYQISKPQNKAGIKVVTVEQGENRNSIAKKLVDQKIIDNPQWFTLYLRITKRASAIKAGNHPVQVNSNIKAIVNELEATPQTDQVWATIPEGLRADEIADALDLAFSEVEDGKFDKSEFDQIVKDPMQFELSTKAKAFLEANLPEGKSLEGFLYPDTYSFEANSTAIIVVSKMIETLESKISANKIDVNSQLGNFYDNLIVASMLEREAFNTEEAAMIADIIHRRLEQNYPLGIDATSLYVLKDWKAPLTFKELADPNPYNTRLKTGLTPTPISNPGIEGIIAAYKPKSNEYLYYLHGSDGKIYYAKTNAEHESNKRYL